jgi:hypothetical protein
MSANPGPISLAQWMETEGLDDEDVVDRLARVDVKTDRSSVNRYRRGQRRPEWDVIAGLKKISKGRVTADSFLELEAGK